MDSETCCGLEWLMSGVTINSVILWTNVERAAEINCVQEDEHSNADSETWFQTLLLISPGHKNTCACNVAACICTVCACTCMHLWLNLIMNLQTDKPVSIF